MSAAAIASVNEVKRRSTAHCRDLLGLVQSAIHDSDEIDLIVQFADHFGVMSADDAGTNQREPELVGA
jgi:hypothetical protein